jgi:serine/threonine-protein kinase HipA
MARRPTHPPLRVYQNNQLVGHLLKEASGAIQFRYDETWLNLVHAYPVSLSLPLREDAYRGQVVSAVFENLLPDSDAVRRRVAEKMGANGIDAFSMLSIIGGDCVGALQFIVGDDDDAKQNKIEGQPLKDNAIEALLKNLAQAPLGLTREDDFRISVAGAQEKTALLWHEGQWLKPHGTTPTTHIFKTQIGKLPNGIDLSNSVENEFYCLKLVEAFGLAVNHVEIKTFGKTKSLVIQRFDRQWTKGGGLLRLPQEDCCQALSIPPSRKYQSEGGPGIVEILDLLKGSDTPAQDQHNFFKAQILFWLIGATDGHAKNFSLFLKPGGGFQMTPLYDILTAQPAFDTRIIDINQMKLAMHVGNTNHYRINTIRLSHFIETGKKAGLPKQLMQKVIVEIIEQAEKAITTVEANLQKGFPEDIPASVKAAMITRLRSMSLNADLSKDAKTSQRN